MLIQFRSRIRNYCNSVGNNQSHGHSLWIYICWCVYVICISDASLLTDFLFQKERQTILIFFMVLCFTRIKEEKGGRRGEKKTIKLQSFPLYPMWKSKERWRRNTSSVCKLHSLHSLILDILDYIFMTVYTSGLLPVWHKYICIQ